MMATVQRFFAITLALLAVFPASPRAALLVAQTPAGAPASEARYRVRLREPGSQWQVAPVYAFFEQEVEVQVAGEPKTPCCVRCVMASL